MLDALVHRQDRYVTGSAQAPGVEQLLEAAQHPRGTVGRREDPIDEVRTRKVKLLLRNGLAFVPKKARVGAQDRFDAARCRAADCRHAATSQLVRDPTTATGNRKSSTIASCRAR